ncbi:MAG: type IV pili methyl-accepting chemotaxis transducer N-terminal domain-containing protein [Pseudomonadota bacterium]
MKFFTAAVSFAVASTVLVADPVPADEVDALKALAAMHSNDVLSYSLESDAADRIRFSDRLTMLTQQVAAASCALTSGVAVDESHFHLEEAMHEMDIILDALRYGNEALHIIGPEQDRRILHDIELLAEEWTETHGAVENVLANGQDVESSHIIDDHNLSLLEKATVISSDIKSEYTHPYEMTQADAMLISIAGRQRMLTQKMAKDACEIWSGYHAEEGRKDLVETMTVFENSLNALLHGMPAAGIQKAPTEAIATDLNHLLARWNVIRGNLDKLVAGEELNQDQKYEIFHDFNEELAELEHLIHDYKLYVERNHAG